MPVKIAAFALGAIMAANGVFMFVDPAAWYAAVPGVPDTGPLNEHFVRDIGLAYLTAGLALVWSELGAGWRASALGATFITLHAGLHVGETIHGQHHAVIINELVAVHLPAILAIVIAMFQRRAHA